MGGSFSKALFVQCFGSGLATFFSCIPEEGGQRHYANKLLPKLSTAKHSAHKFPLACHILCIFPPSPRAADRYRDRQWGRCDSYLSRIWGFCPASPHTTAGCCWKGHYTLSHQTPPPEGICIQSLCRLWNHSHDEGEAMLRRVSR